MRKGYLYPLTVAIVIALILFAGCTTSNQTNQGANTTTSTSSTTTTATSSSTTTSATITPSPRPSSSPSPTVATPTPSASGIATSIQFAREPNVVKGTSLGINVIASGIRICSNGAVTVVGASGKTIGTVSSGGSSDCYYTAYLDTSSLNPGIYDVTLKFAGDSTYQSSQSTSKITITA